MFSFFFVLEYGPSFYGGDTVFFFLQNFQILDWKQIIDC